MKPGDHPEFFRFPAPQGRSRESTLRLDREGRFWHDGALVEHAGLAAGLHGWITRHPDDGRYILSNGYDWTYFSVEDAPFVVRSLRVEPQRVVLVLSDGTEEDWVPETSRLGADGAVYARVKAGAPRGPFEAKFSRHAQTSLEPLLVARAGDGEGGNASGVSDEPDEHHTPAVRIRGNAHAIGAKSAGFG
jgi:hypothetical protein